MQNTGVEDYGLEAPTFVAASFPIVVNPCAPGILWQDALGENTTAEHTQGLWVERTKQAACFSATSPDAVPGAPQGTGGSLQGAGIHPSDVQV